MPKKNDDFFVSKKSWSVVKDELLGCYLKPYIQKVLFTRKPIVYVDCFSGKGKFDDGTLGSPLIALNIFDDCIKHTKADFSKINPYFIDLNYANDLKFNLKSFNLPNENIISGKYEDKIYEILNKYHDCNLFLYIDPYGIKALNCNFFDNIVQSKKFSSIELLINLNSYGFIREACRVMKVDFGDESILDDLVEYDSTTLSSNEHSKEILNQIAGGAYWQDVIQRKKKGEITTKQAEVIFSELFCNRLRKEYKYVLNMPLRIKRGQVPKYRMIHATNHVEGCLIMANNIQNRWQLMKDIQSNGQVCLFDEDIDNNFIDDKVISSKVEDYIKRYTNFKHLNEFLSEFFMEYGPICSTSDINKVLRNFEKLNKIEVFRNPAITQTGKKSQFFSEEKKQTTMLRWLD